VNIYFLCYNISLDLLNPFFEHYLFDFLLFLCFFQYRIVLFVYNKNFFFIENAVWGRQVVDGPSHVWLCSFVLSPAAQRQLRGEEPMSAGVEYAQKFMQKDDSFHGCFKTIFQLANPEDSTVSAALGFTGRSLLRNYNGKPYLSNNSHRVRRVSLLLFVVVCCCCLLLLFAVVVCCSNHISFPDPDI